VKVPGSDLIGRERVFGGVSERFLRKRACSTKVKGGFVTGARILRAKNVGNFRQKTVTKKGKSKG